MTAILGLSAYYHDSAAALIVDGRIVAAAQEERFSRVKHDERFPRQAIDYCLAEAGLGPEDIDHVVFYEKPYLKFERLLETHLAVAPKGLRSFFMAMPLWIRDKLRLPSRMSQGLDGRYKRRFVYPEHHESHAASAFFPSPFEEAAILTLDGVGEWATACLGQGRGNRIELTHEMRFPHSLGLLYSAFTYFCGFRVNSGEYKLMGLAPFGHPKYESLIREKLIDLKDDGSFRIDLSYFDYCTGLRMTSAKFKRLFGGPPRQPESPITARECDLAASIQSVTETVMLRMAAHARRMTGSDNLCLAGGVALNCVSNGRLLRESPFKRIWVQPASGDAGGALGAALFVWYQLLENERRGQEPDGQSASLLGPSYSEDEIERILRERKAVFSRLGAKGELVSAVARLIADGKVVGWVQGRMEFGPRALGARSILGDARNPAMQSVMNLKVKHRESFRPFAPIVLKDRAPEYFELKEGEESPYMLIVAPIRPDKLVPAGTPAGGGGEGLDRIRTVRSVVPAVTHIDNSARIQTVDRARNPRLTQLLEAFADLTGCPLMINTSFNVRGEPIVCSPADAYRCFMATDIDALAVGDYLMLKGEQPESGRTSLGAYLGQFGRD
ncbi:MAG TPA: carbamoyltransferase [Opitutaceae bacterium]